MKIRYQDDAVTLYQGEALRVLHSLDDNSFDALITDPPYSSGGTTAPSGWFEARAPRGADRSHITEKPVPLMRHLMRPLRPGSRILDPFTGSGTTGVAAKLEGHRFVGVEAVPSIATTAAHRLSQDALDLT